MKRVALAREGLDESGFAGTVGAEDADVLADSDAQGEAVQGNVLSAEHGDVVELEERRSHRGEFTLRGRGNRRGGFVGHDCGENKKKLVANGLGRERLRGRTASEGCLYRG